MKFSILLCILAIVGLASSQLLHYGRLENNCNLDEEKLHSDYYKAGICAPKCKTWDDASDCPTDFADADKENSPVRQCIGTGWMGLEGTHCVLACAGPNVGRKNCPEGAKCGMVSVSQGRKMFGTNFQSGYSICFWPDTNPTESLTLIED